MKKKFSPGVLVLLAVLLAAGTLNCQKAEENKKLTGMFPSIEKNSKTSISNLSMTDVFDNVVYNDELATSWGFSCIIKGIEKTILFDTGGDGSILMAYIKDMGINPGDVDVVVLSHFHGDHVDGLMSFLAENPEVVVYMPQSFPDEFKNEVKEQGTKIVEVGEPVKICDHVYSTGEMGIEIIEQSMVINTEKGLIVMTGCAHPGIAEIVKKANDLIDAPILFVTGGFHLGSESDSRIKEIISSFRELGVRYAAPCHCSGDNVRKLFKEEYKTDFVENGLGRVITLNDLK